MQKYIAYKALKERVEEYLSPGKIETQSKIRDEEICFLLCPTSNDCVTDKLNLKNS